MASPFDVPRYLQGLKWPATKDEVIGHAREQGADDAALAMFEGLPDEEFTSENHISQSLGAYGPAPGTPG